MFKKHVLAAAVLALTAGVASADNEAIITQLNDPSASMANVEQIYADGNVNFGQIVQESSSGDGTTTNAVVFQGAASDVGAVDPTAPASTNVAGTAIDLGLPAWIDNTTDASGAALAYAPLNAAVANFGYVKQDTTDNARAMIVQLSADDAAAFATASTLYANDLTADNSLGNTVGLADGGTLTDSAGNELISAGALSTLFDNIADSAANTDNIAAISQGSEVSDRTGAVLGGALNDGGADDVALIIQLGSGNIGQIMQSGDSQFASIIQGDTGNDALVAQYAGSGNIASVVQVAVNDIATIYQSGDSNIATINQHQPF